MTRLRGKGSKREKGTRRERSLEKIREKDGGRKRIRKAVCVYSFSFVSCHISCPFALNFCLNKRDSIRFDLTMHEPGIGIDGSAIRFPVVVQQLLPG